MDLPFICNEKQPEKISSYNSSYNFRGRNCIDSVLINLCMEGGPGDVKKPGGLGPVAVGKLQGLVHHHGGNRVNEMLITMVTGQVRKIT